MHQENQKCKSCKETEKNKKGNNENRKEKKFFKKAVTKFKNRYIAYFSKFCIFLSYLSTKF